MGEVYQARDLRLERDVAIKVVRARVAHEPQRVALLRQEAMATARLNHPNIVTVYEIGQDGDLLYIVSELLHGVSLRTRLSEGRLPSAVAVQWAKDIARALAAAHERGIIHRDLKPENVFITQDGRIKLLDFGLAKLLRVETAGSRDAAHGGGTAPSVVAGTPGYMAPEQLHGRPTDHRADIYAFGAVLYEMLSGRRDDSDATRRHIRSVPARFRGLVQRCLAAEPDERFQSARELISILEAPVRLPARGTISLAVATSAAVLTVALSLPVGEPIRQWVSRQLSRAQPTGVFTTQLSLAVLPVANLSGDPQTEQVGVGIASTVVHNLATVPGVTVASQIDTAPFRAGNRNAQAALRDLGVASILDIALERASDRFRMHVNFHRTTAGERVWARDYSGDVLAIHRELLRDLPELLRTAGFQRRLEQPEVTRLMKVPTASAAALFYYSEGRSLLVGPDATRHVERAIAALERSVEQDPRFVAAMTSLGDAYLLHYDQTLDAKWLERAAEYAQAALAIDAADASVHMSLARLKQKSGQLADAIHELRIAVQLTPDSDDAHRMLGYLLSQRAEHDEATRELQHAVSLRPYFWNNHYILGHAYYNARRYGDAIASFKRVTDLQPNFANGFVMLGASHERAGAIEQAIGNYEHAARLGESATAYANLGALYLISGRHDAALSAYQIAIDKDSSSPVIWQNFGDVYARLGRRADALRAYRTAVGLLEKQLATNPRDAGAIIALGLCEAKLGHQVRAEQRAAEAFALQPKDAEVLYKRAAVYAVLKQRQRALDSLRAAIENGFEPALARDDDDLASISSSAEYNRLVGTVVKQRSR
jgi:serine/threonine-protein kinase